MVTETQLLEDAIALAVEAHRGQADKAGAPYILHPLRVMLRMARPVEQVVAMLHDVVEDCGWTLERLRERGFPPEVCAALGALTRRPGESYEGFVLRAKADPIARTVKLADLQDNMDVRRLGELTAEDCERLRKYQRAWRTLSDG